MSAVEQNLVNTIINGDCLEVMRTIADKSIDMIVCDLPYGTTACKWDVIIPFEPLWEQYKRIIKPRGAIVLTASQPFTSQLVMSNPKWFRYEWIWEKEQGVNFQLAKYQPLKIHESALIFSERNPRYFPQGIVQCSITKSNRSHKHGRLGHIHSHKIRHFFEQTQTNYPKSIQRFVREVGLHPTQKPVSLFSYLIKTYTNEGDLVLDNCAGSGTTAIACLETDRRYICIEKDPGYFEIMKDRITKWHNDKLNNTGTYQLPEGIPRTNTDSGQLSLW